MRQIRCSLGLVLIFALAHSAYAGVGEPSGDGVAISTDHADGQMQVNESVTWTIHQTKPAPKPLHYRLLENNLKVIDHGDLTPSEDKTLTAKLDHAGWLYLVIENDESPDNRLVQSAGVLVGPEQIKPSIAAPDDFASFWHDQISQIEKVPANAKVTPGDAELPGVRYEEILLDNVDGAHVHAQLARPDKAGKFPGLVLFQYAGVYPLPKNNVTKLAADGWLALNVMAHDLPLHEPAAYYNTLKLDGQPASNYIRIGDTSREKSYFRKMLLGDYQAIEYLRARPDWDGNVLFVRGESQGGMQSIAMAGLNPHVTACAVTVPAGADTLGLLAGREPGWPYWFRQGGGDETQQKAIDTTSRYYDLVNFAPLIRCPTFVAAGARDTTSPPIGVTAMSNAITSPHELVLMPTGTHRKDHAEGYARLTIWQEALLKTGKAPTN